MKQPEKIQLPRRPTYLKLAEDHDIFELFCKIEKTYDHCFLFESLGEESNITRHHVIGFDPYQIIYADDYHTLCISDNKGKTTRYASDNPYNDLRKIIPQNVISNRNPGGLVGYIGYDAINFFEKNLNIQSNTCFEPFKFGVYLDGLIYDQVTGEIFYFYYTESRFNTLKTLIKRPAPRHEKLSVSYLGETMTQQAHEHAVKKVKKDICEGLIFQCEVGFKVNYKIAGDTLPIYEKLRKSNPSPHMYYMKFGPQKIIGASPELLFRLRNQEMETFPLAGTTKRGKTPSEDTQLARKLLNDPKEIAEHNMLVDLHRNDISRVAQFGTVKVRSLMDIKRYSHVQHISSEIVGLLDNSEDMFSALAANFPAGTLTGAPKIEAMKIINALETSGRGPYGGAVGQFCFNGDCIFAIPIRTIFINNEDAYVQTSGGNVFDSNAEDEYQEIQQKFMAMKNVLSSFIET